MVNEVSVKTAVQSGVWLKQSLYESIIKLSNFNFQWTKTLYQNNLKHIAFFSTIFQRL